MMEVYVKRLYVTIEDFEYYNLHSFIGKTRIFLTNLELEIIIWFMVPQWGENLITIPGIPKLAF